MVEIALSATVTGKVRDVGYLPWIKELALKNEVRGWTSNGVDGAIAAVLVGLPANVESVASALRGGPKEAEVTDVTIEAIDPPPRCSEFKIKSSRAAT